MQETIPLYNSSVIIEQKYSMIVTMLGNYWRHRLNWRQVIIFQDKISLNFYSCIWYSLNYSARGREDELIDGHSGIIL